MRRENAKKATPAEKITLLRLRLSSCWDGVCDGTVLDCVGGELGVCNGEGVSSRIRFS